MDDARTHARTCEIRRVERVERRLDDSELIDCDELIENDEAQVAVVDAQRQLRQRQRADARRVEDVRAGDGDVEASLDVLCGQRRDDGRAQDDVS